MIEKTKSKSRQILRVSGVSARQELLSRQAGALKPPNFCLRLKEKRGGGGQ